MDDLFHTLCFGVETLRRPDLIFRHPDLTVICLLLGTVEQQTQQTQWFEEFALQLIMLIHAIQGLRRCCVPLGEHPLLNI
jgi:hypothetical protein